MLSVIYFFYSKMQFLFKLTFLLDLQHSKMLLVRSYPPNNSLLLSLTDQIEAFHQLKKILKKAHSLLSS